MLISSTSTQRIKSETFATGCFQIKLNMTWYWHQIKSLLLGCLQLLYPTHAYGANFCNDLSRTFYKLPNTFIFVDNIQISLKLGDLAWPKTFLLWTMFTISRSSFHSTVTKCWQCKIFVERNLCEQINQSIETGSGLICLVGRHVLCLLVLQWKTTC